LLRARERLRGGDVPGALALLDEARARFPEGALVQEREALTIEALARRDDAAARTRADAFLRDHPESLHAERIRALADDSAAAPAP
jgi:outer membrane protein assembly factor BamD (BamD/ComL family)